MVSTVTMAKGTAASRILKQLSHQKRYKARTRVSLVRMALKGAVKRKMPKTAVSTSGGLGHIAMTLCINGVCVIYKDAYSTMIINNQICFFCTMFHWWHMHAIAIT